jgi:hypothetical protein
MTHEITIFQDSSGDINLMSQKLLVSIVKIGYTFFFFGRNLKLTYLKAGEYHSTIRKSLHFVTVQTFTQDAATQSRPTDRHTIKRRPVCTSDFHSCPRGSRQ